MKATIFVVEDDPDILEILQFNLDKEGFRVKLEKNGEKAFEAISAHPPDLIVLDLNLPELSGIEICKYLRENPRTKEIPIIMLTARSQEIDKIIGFEIGADDYVTKPFSMRELIARIHALLRRSRPTLSNVVTIENLTIYLNMHKVSCGDRELTLTPTEYKLLEALVHGKGRVLSRSDLLEIVWGMDYYGETRTVDVHIKRLRDKLGTCAEVIETVKGTGYRLKI
ncbi:MAG: response regulator [Calditrichaeota bacterium]|nr:response regulator [Calditrichota bacterium]RQW01928.1 MAG: response regulator [Calditrichota bacterium]